jgi:ABC-type transporter MlaC component
MSEEGEITEAKWSISLGTLTVVAVSLCIGAAAAELLRNISGAEKLTFSTTELVGFVLSVVLSAASIVLAVAAIWMGKVTELAIIRRSDESIRLQNEVFVRTTEALQRIEASTGVTEKRIEDIIQGRVGDISHKIAELATSRTGLMRDRASLEEEIRNSILTTVRPERSTELSLDLEGYRKKTEERQKRYKDYHQTLLNSYANLPTAKTLKLGDGKFKGSGHDLFDVVVEVNGVVIGASAFTEASATDEDFTSYLMRIAHELLANTIQRAVLFIDGDRSEQSKFAARVSAAMSQLKGDPQDRVEVFSVLAQDVPGEVTASSGT